MVFYVNSANCDFDCPSVGWYYIKEDSQGKETTHGPFHTKYEALDHSTDGEYSRNIDYMREDAHSTKSYFESNGWD
jgi:hypothetical protein